MKQVEIKLFEYDELEETAKSKAFDEHEIFLRENPSDFENENGEMEYENMDEYTQEELKEYVEESIRINEYFFFEDGTLASCTTYTGKHEKSGTTELKFCGSVYEVI